MALNYDKPDTRLLRELQAVADHARELTRVLETAANIKFPDDFPFEEVELLTKTLMGLPDGTAEGSKEILDYGRARFAHIGRRFIKHGDEAEGEADEAVPPGLERGMAADRAIRELLSSISYAQAEYSEQSGEAIDDDSGAETGVRPGSDLADDLSELGGDLQAVEGETEELGRKIEETTLATSARADRLGRQVRDAGGHAGLARNELQQPEPKPGRLERINRVLAQLPDVIEKTGQAMQVGIDIGKPFADQWFNQVPTDIFNLVVKHLRLAAKNVEKAGQRLKAGLQPSTRSNGHPSFTVFRDIDEPWCPEMVMLPAGRFLMGSPESEDGRDADEGPQHEVTIGRPFAMGCYSVTFDEYDHFCAETTREKPDDRGWGRGRRPVINVRHEDAESYCAWLSEKAGLTYQLPSEAMWEYACRAGTTTAFAFGNDLTREQANFGHTLRKTSEVGAYPANAWGLHDMHGNVWEHCQDWFHESYEAAPDDGSAWLTPAGILRVLRGGSWLIDAQNLRSAGRDRYSPDERYDVVGFRCARVQEA